jgi:hypothetical protein
MSTVTLNENTPLIVSTVPEKEQVGNESSKAETQSCSQRQMTTKDKILFAVTCTAETALLGIIFYVLCI